MRVEVEDHGHAGDPEQRAGRGGVFGRQRGEGFTVEGFVEEEGADEGGGEA